MNYNIQDIATIVSGNLLAYKSNATITKIVYDSRIATKDEGSIFVALVGNIDGHSFIEDAFEKGIRSFIISKSEIYKGLPQNIKSGSNIILVANTLNAIQLLGKYHRKSFSNPILAISGSNGKTVVKEWLYHLMYLDKNIHRSPKSFNSQLGVPISILGLEQEHELGIIEAGVSQKGEMAVLEEIIKPDYAIFTNIGLAHEEGFLNTKEKIKEKLILFKDAKKFFFCNDHENICHEVNQYAELQFFTPNVEFYSWGHSLGADLRIIQVKKSNHFSDIEAVFKSKNIHIRVPFIDDASIDNAMHCWLFLIVYGYGQKTIEDRMLGLTQIEMRLELKEGINNCTVINDTYNSDLNSLTIALDVLNQQNQHAKKTLILSDILQSGKTEEDLYKEVIEVLEQKKVQKIIGIGNSLVNQKKLFGQNAILFNTVDQFLESFNVNDFKNEAILVKGARLFSFERIVKKLQKKVHSTVLEINLQNIIHNLNVYRSQLDPKTKIMVMVKAFSYGSGSFEIANILQYQKVDYLAVAYPDEGAELRKHGIKLPIMVMNPDPESFTMILEENLEPEIYSFRTLAKLIEECKSTYFKREVNIHLKIETGMNRLGFNESEIGGLLELIGKHPYLKIKSVFSHLVSTDYPDHDKFTIEQIEKFKRISENIEIKLNYPILKHILNSVGISRFNHAQLDMVRLGIGLYGLDASGLYAGKLKPVSTLKSFVSQIKYVKKGETIGYLRKGVAKENMKVATIGIGYADGFPRVLGNGVGEVVIQGKRAKTIGNVCMDMTMIDVTNIDVQEGDEVILFNSDQSINKMAKQANTIPYEILTNVSQRVKRVYFKE